MSKNKFLQKSYNIGEDATVILKQVFLMRAIATGSNMYSTTWQFYFKGTLKEFHFYHISLILFLCFLKSQVKNKETNKAIDLLLNILSIVYIFPVSILLLDKGFNALNLSIPTDKLIFFSRHAFFIALESKGKEFSTSFFRYIQKYVIPAASYQWTMNTGPLALVFLSKKVKHPILYIGSSIFALLLVKQLLLSEKKEKKNFSTINQEYPYFFEILAFCLTETAKPFFLVILDLTLVTITTSLKKAIESSFPIEIPFNFSEFLNYPIEKFYVKKKLEIPKLRLAPKKTIEVRVKREKDPYAFKSLKHDTIFIKPYTKKPLPKDFKKVTDPFLITRSNQPIWKQGAIKLLPNYLDIYHVGSFFPLEEIETKEIKILYKDLLGKFYLVKNLFASETQALIMQTEPLIDNNKPFLANPHLKVKNQKDFYPLFQNFVKKSWGSCECADLQIDQKFSYADCEYAFALKGNLKSFKDSLEYKIYEKSDSLKVELEEISSSPEISEILTSEKTLEILGQETQKTHSEKSETLAMEKVRIENAKEIKEQEVFVDAEENLVDLDKTREPEVFVDAEENLVDLEEILEPVQEMLVIQDNPERNYQLNANHRYRINNLGLLPLLVLATMVNNAAAQVSPAPAPNLSDQNITQTIVSPVAPNTADGRTGLIVSYLSLAVSGIVVVILVGQPIFNRFRLRAVRTQGDSETGRQSLIVRTPRTQPTVRTQDRALAASRVDEAPSSPQSQTLQTGSGLDLQQSQPSTNTGQSSAVSNVLRPGVPLSEPIPEGTIVFSAESELHRQNESQQGQQHGEHFDEQRTTASAVENLTSELGSQQETGAISTSVADLIAQTGEATAPANQEASAHNPIFNIAHEDPSTNAIDAAFAANPAGAAVLNYLSNEEILVNPENELSGEGEISDTVSENSIGSLLSEDIGDSDIDAIARSQRLTGFDYDAELDQAVSLPDRAAVSLTTRQENHIQKILTNASNAKNLGLLNQIVQNNYTPVVFDRESLDKRGFKMKVIFFHPKDEKDNNEIGTGNTIFFIAGTGIYNKKSVTPWINKFMADNNLKEDNKIETEQHHICGCVYFLSKNKDCATGITYFLNQILIHDLLSEVASVPVEIGNDKTALIQHQVNAYKDVLTRGNPITIFNMDLGKVLTLDQIMEIISYGIEQHYEVLEHFFESMQYTPKCYLSYFALDRYSHDINRMTNTLRLGAEKFSKNIDSASKLHKEAVTVIHAYGVVSYHLKSEAADSDTFRNLLEQHLTNAINAHKDWVKSINKSLCAANRPELTYESWEKYKADLKNVPPKLEDMKNLLNEIDLGKELQNAKQDVTRLTKVRGKLSKKYGYLDV